MKKNFYLILIVFFLFSVSCNRKKSTEANISSSLQENQRIKEGKVAILFSPVAHLSVLLGKESVIGALPHGSTRDKMLLSFYPRLKKLPVIKKGGRVFYERLVAVEPTLAIGIREDAENRMLQKFLSTLKCDFIEFNMDDQLDRLFPLAKKLGSTEKLKDLIQFEKEVEALVQQCEAIQTHLEDGDLQGKRPTCYFSVLELQRTLAACDREWLAFAGFDVVPPVGIGLVQSGKLFINPEWLFKENPDWIFAIEYNTWKKFLEDRRFVDLKAVKQKQVRLMPTGITRWGHPNSVEKSLALLFVLNARCPEIVTEEILEEKVIYFYDHFWNINLLEDQVSVEKLLSGGWRRERK